MAMLFRKRFLFSVLLAAAFSPRFVFADYPIQTIELRARTLDEILPVVRPLIEPVGTVTGMGNHLVIKAPPAQVREVRALLGTLDRPPRRLTIFVSNSAKSGSGLSGYRASADIKTGDGRVMVNTPGMPGEGSQARVDLAGRDSSRGHNASHRVSGVEGRAAWIGSGSVSPYHATGSGVYVIPRVSGEYVTLEIRQREARPGQVPGVVTTQGSGSIVRGRLGEWISLGGIDTSGRHDAGGFGRALSTSGSTTRQISVFVECPDCRTGRTGADGSQSAWPGIPPGDR